jgi:ADP-L-glycero-D-manno-heptose 6-epimerase
MNDQRLIVVTGAAGFIGSCMVQYLNDKGYENLVLVDSFGVEAKRVNWQQKKYAQIVERENFFEWLAEKKPSVELIIHLGARTDTTEFDYSIHQHLNVDYSISIWNYCTRHNVPLIYASSAATYGAGELGYNDNHDIISQLKPLNPYGVSKNEFDKWVLNQIETETRYPPFWAGLKFFNVYGPNEYHKGRMASVIWHSYNQIKKNGEVKLFKSHRNGFEDGQQLRDFVYVKDVVSVIFFLLESAFTNTELPSGIYNLGTGKARSFYDLASATFKGLDLEPNISFIDMPEDIRDKYQYFTEANMQKLVNAGYRIPFHSLEDGVNDYVRNYLAKNALY